MTRIISWTRAGCVEQCQQYRADEKQPHPTHFISVRGGITTASSEPPLGASVAFIAFWSAVAHAERYAAFLL
jgi:hypothetical protein